MRIIAACLALLALGCTSAPSVTPAAVALRYIGTGLAAEQFPMVFALEVANDGPSPVVVDEVRLQVDYKVPLYDDAGGAPPDGFECVVRIFDEAPAADGSHSPLPEGSTITIAPGETREIVGAVQWVVPEGTPPMLAIIRGAFIVDRAGSSLIDPEPLIMVLQSEAGALEAVRKSTTTSIEKAHAVAKALEAIPGRRSKAFSELIESIEAIANRQI